MSPLELLQVWKSKPYKKTNYENIKAFYDDHKYIKMKPNSQISLTEGFFHVILKHPKEWVQQNFKLEREVTLCNETNSFLYFTVIQSLIFDEEKEYKLHVKNGVEGTTKNHNLC
jgi:hypothetical protein